MPVASNDQIAGFEKQLTNMKITHWLNEDLFSPAWWLMLVVLVVPWIIWWRYVNRTRILQITLVGMLTLILSSYLDAIGSELALWQYNKMLIPIWSRLITVDFAIMPVTYMFIYQYFTEWRIFMIASVIMAFLYAFVVEPMVVWIGIYQLNSWNHWYSFIIYIILSLSTKSIVDKLVARSYV